MLFPHFCVVTSSCYSKGVETLSFGLRRFGVAVKIFCVTIFFARMIYVSLRSESLRPSEIILTMEINLPMDRKYIPFEEG